MFVDTHMHEMTCSKDSFLKLEEMVEIAREKGLGAICITDHDDMGLKEYAAEYSKKTGFPIFVGIEFFSLQGDIIAFGIEEYPDERISAQDFIDLVKAQGGFCFAAHPFRNNNRGLEENFNRLRSCQCSHCLFGFNNRDWAIVSHSINCNHNDSTFLSPFPQSTHIDSFYHHLWKR